MPVIQRKHTEAADEPVTEDIGIVDVDLPDEDDPAGELRPPGALRSLWTRLADPRSPALIYAGLVAIAAGFGLVAYTWGRVAGLLSVPLQLPYIASGGLTAIGLVALGSVLVTMGTSRREAVRQQARLDELAMVLRAIRETLDGDQG